MEGGKIGLTRLLSHLLCRARFLPAAHTFAKREVEIANGMGTGYGGHWGIGARKEVGECNLGDGGGKSSGLHFGKGFLLTTRLDWREGEGEGGDEKEEKKGWNGKKRAWKRKRKEGEGKERRGT